MEKRQKELKDKFYSYLNAIYIYNENLEVVVDISYFLNYLDSTKMYADTLYILFINEHLYEQISAAAVEKIARHDGHSHSCRHACFAVLTPLIARVVAITCCGSLLLSHKRE